MKKQNGFSAVIALLSILVVTAIGFTGYYVWNTQQDMKEDTNSSTAPVTNVTPKPITQTVSYKNICLKNEPLCLDYPKDWKAQLSSSSMANDVSNYPSDSLKITSNGGAVIEIQTGIDGIGGGCEDETYPDSDRTKVIKSEKSKITDNLYVAKVKFNSNTAYANNGEEKIWLIAQNEVVPTVNKDDLLHCTAAFNVFQTLTGLKNTMRIEATNLNDADEDEIFKIFQSIKIGENQN